MDTTRESEGSSEVAEVDMLKDQLQTYMSLNMDLSRKVQELKIMLSVTNKEIVSVRNELIGEKLRSSELERTLQVINGHFTVFLGNYVSNLENCKSRINMDVTLPGFRNDAPSLITVNDQSSSGIQFRPNRFQYVAPVDSSHPNILHTICEEDSLMIDSSGPKVSSTPLPAALYDITTRRKPETLIPCTSPINSNSKSVDQENIHNPKPNFRNLVQEEADDDEISANRQSVERTSNETNQSGVVQSSDESNGSMNPQEAANISNVLLDLVVDITDYIPTDSQMDLFNEKFQKEATGINTSKAGDVIAQPEESNQGNDRGGTEVKESSSTEVKKESVEQQLMEQDENDPTNQEDKSLSSLDNTSSTSASSVQSNPRKRKIKTVVARRSAGRPRRKVRSEGPLTEAKLNTKMRRAK